MTGYTVRDAAMLVASCVPDHTHALRRRDGMANSHITATHAATLSVVCYFIVVLIGAVSGAPAWPRIIAGIICGAIAALALAVMSK